MHSSIARGFYVMLLSKGEREKLRDLEKSLPQGRYLTNAELTDVFRQEIPKEKKSISVLEEKEMEDLWQQYNREVWKAKKITKFQTDKVLVMATPSTIPGRTIPLENGVTEVTTNDDAAAFGNWVGMDPEERYNWGEYAVSHYRRPHGSVSRMDEAFGMA